MHYALPMDKLSAGLKVNLLQHLLRSTQGAGMADAARAPGSNARVDASPLSQLLAANLTATASSTQINLPPALRQLLAEHAQLHQLLPQLRSIQGMLGQTSPGATASLSGSGTGPQVTAANMQLLANLLPTLTQQLGGNGQPLAASHIRNLVSQWFSFHPGQALTAPPPAQNATWLSQLGPLLQWMLVQRSSNQPLTSLLQQATQGSNTNTAAAGLPATTLASLSSLLLGSMQDIRLSQVHLADTAAQQQPEYYLVLPYQVGDKAHVLEWLLRKKARAAQQQTPDSWTFSLRFETLRYGPLLVKGSYTAAAADNEDAQPLTKLRFYLQGESEAVNTQAVKQGFEQALEQFIQRLDKAGIANVKHEVHLGVVPTTLAPTAHELVQSKPSTRGPYG